jgi:hypothetical protein
MVPGEVKSNTSRGKALAKNVGRCGHYKNAGVQNARHSLAFVLALAMSFLSTFLALPISVSHIW